jgi:hypothetical protein
MGKRADQESEQPYIVESHVKAEHRQQEKRTGKDGKPGKAGKVQHKGGASTSHKESGGKMAR